MRSSVSRMCALLTVGGALAVFSSSARADDSLPSINTPPSGPGTPERTRPGGPRVIREGIEASAGIGTGFADTYGLGFEGRVGYTFRSGVYVGGAGQYYVGHTVNESSAYAGFFGAELGYKFFPKREIEIRPYVFAGPSFIRQVASSPFIIDTQTNFAIQPGLIAMYHFGPAFVGGDVHVMAYPTPTTVAVLASAGVNF